jgi:hypothetical protein
LRCGGRFYQYNGRLTSGPRSKGPEYRLCDFQSSQYRHYRPRRSWQDHPRRSIAQAVEHARCARDRT